MCIFVWVYIFWESTQSIIYIIGARCSFRVFTILRRVHPNPSSRIYVYMYGLNDTQTNCFGTSEMWYEETKMHISETKNYVVHSTTIYTYIYIYIYMYMRKGKVLCKAYVISKHIWFKAQQRQSSCLMQIKDRYSSLCIVHASSLGMCVMWIFNEKKLFCNLQYELTLCKWQVLFWVS